MPFTEQALAAFDAALSDDTEMAAFDDGQQLTDWVAYAPGVHFSFDQQTAVSHIAVRSAATRDVLITFLVDERGGRKLLLPGDTVEPPPQPWAVNWSYG